MTPVGDYDGATNAFSKALQVRVELYGELAPECAQTYYEYGCALLEKVQSERDSLGNTKEAETGGAEGDDQPAGDQEDAEQGSAKPETSEAENGREDQDEVQDEDETEVELAWKVMDIARVIHEKKHTHSLDEVDVH